MTWDIAADIFAILGHAVPATLALLAWLSSRSVHAIVNSQRTDMMREIDRLRKEIARLHEPTQGTDD